MTKNEVIKAIFNSLERSSKNFNYYYSQVNAIPYHLLKMVESDLNIKIQTEDLSFNKVNIEVYKTIYEDIFIETCVVHDYSKDKTKTIKKDIEINKKITKLNGITYLGNKYKEYGWGFLLYFKNKDLLIEVLNKALKIEDISNKLYSIMRWRKDFINLIVLESDEYLKTIDICNKSNINLNHTIGYWMLTMPIAAHDSIFKKILNYQKESFKKITEKSLNECILNLKNQLIDGGKNTASFLRYLEQLEESKSNILRLLQPIRLKDNLNFILDEKNENKSVLIKI